MAADFATRFYFATLVSKEGGIPEPDVFASSATTHAQLHWNLINNVKQEDWDHRYGFVLFRFDNGSIFFPSGSQSTATSPLSQLRNFRAL